MDEDKKGTDAPVEVEGKPAETTREYELPWRTCVACGVRDSNVIEVKGRGLHEDALRCHALRLGTALGPVWEGERVSFELSIQEKVEIESCVKNNPFELIDPDYEPMKKGGDDV